MTIAPPTSPLPVIGQALQAAKGLIVPAAMAGAAMTFANRENRKALKADVNQYKSGDLGLSQAQRAQMLGQTQNALAAQQQANQAQMGQLAAAGSLSGGQLAQIAAAQQAQQNQALGQAQQSIDAQSQAQTDARRREIRGALAAKAADNMQQAQIIGNSIASNPPQFGSAAAPDLQSVQTGVNQRAFAGVS